MKILRIVPLVLIGFLSFSTAHADVVLTMGGDVNFNRNRMDVDPRGVVYGESVMSWESLTRQIRPLINGDLNFANIETVVSSRNDLTNQNKAFAFKSHPDGIRRLLDMGFNLFNLANNHAYDYGFEGMNQTLYELRGLQQEYPRMIYAGMGFRNDILKPRVFTVNGIRIAFASISIVDAKFQASNDYIGLLQIRSDKDMKDLIAAFAKTDADFKILSTHFGVEGVTTLDPGQKSRFEYAVRYGGINLIIGHHPHVIRPIQKWGDRFIFYSLGNYLMAGSADITKKADTNADWGMFSRLYLERDPATGRVKVDAVEVIPLTNTHSRTTPMTAENAMLRIDGLNQLSYDQIGEYGLNLKIDTISGQGFYCDEQMNSVRAKAMCSGRFSPRY